MAMKSLKSINAIVGNHTTSINASNGHTTNLNTNVTQYQLYKLTLLVLDCLDVNHRLTRLT